MAEYDPNFLAEQSLYGGSGRDGHSGSGGAGHAQHRGGNNAAIGDGGWTRHRGGRRSGGGGSGHGGWQGGARGAGGHHNQAPRDVFDGDEHGRRRMRDTLFRLGDMTDGATEFHPPSELYRLKQYIEQESLQGGYDTISRAIKVMAAEQPHKIPLTAALLGFLVLDPTAEHASAPAVDAGEPDVSVEADTNLGLRLTRDLASAFRVDLDARHWRNVRLLLHLFAALVPLAIVEASSFRRVLTSIAAVLDEPGVAAARGDRAAMCIIETLCRAGRDLCFSTDEAGEHPAALQQLDDLVERVERYTTDYRNIEVDLAQPFAPLQDSLPEGEDDWLHEDSFETSVDALRALRVREYRKPEFLPAPFHLLPPPLLAAVQTKTFTSIVLPDILVPPDDDFAEGPIGASSQHTAEPHEARTRRRRGGNRQVKPVRADEVAAYRAGAGLEQVYRYSRWFKDTVPYVASPDSIVLRAIFHDIIDLYQVNRKECSRILFALPRWHRKGTFASKAVTPDMGIFGDPESTWQVGMDGKLQGGWSLDELIVESILSTSLVLPVPPQKPLYYTTLLREVVTISPQSIAPAMGKSVRRVYASLSSGRTDAEVVRRFADWFSVHLSNFNFNWNWKEWIPDISLPEAHPKVVFARRLVELEIRLAYFERVRQSLPEEVQGWLLPAQEPTPVFTYGAEEHPFREQAVALIQSMRARATAEVILADLEGFRKDISPDTSAAFVPSNDKDDRVHFKVGSAHEAEIAIRDVVIQAILSIGSRSFSHFLNVVERYHALLRQLSTSPAMRQAILSSTVRFWHKAPQWILIVTDKWLQYRIIEPTDVIDFIFASPTDHPEVVRGATDVAQERAWSNFVWWELIKLTGHKVQGRVDQVRKRLEGMQREEAERLERLEAVREAGNGEDATTDVKLPEQPTQALFPSGATVSTLPRRPELPPLESEVADVKKAVVVKAENGGSTAEQGTGNEKKQTVEDAKLAFDNITREQRKVLIRTLTGFVELLQSAPPSIWARARQEHNDDAAWQLWWAKSWFVEYCRLFSKTLMANHETIVANVFATTGEEDNARDVFERGCQMATE